MDQKRFAVYTEAILKKLPYWFKVRKNSKDSIGAKFLDVIGLSLDDIRFMLDYAYAQTYIDTADINQVDILYRAELHDSIDVSRISGVHHSMGGLAKAETLPEFMGASPEELRDPMIYDKPYYFIDSERKLLYVHQPYYKNMEHKHGRITIIYNYIHYEYPLQMHHLWNFFDEFGMLLNCPRLHGEKNVDYKKRILDVFKNVANSSKRGFLNGLARELGMRQYVTWEDGSQDLIIEDKMIVLNEIQIDGEKVPLDKVFINKDDNIVLLGDYKYKDVVRTVEYVSGVEMHQLSNRDDIPLFNELVKVDGTATDLLKYYTDRLKTLAPISWGYFVWNESYWDIAEEENGGLAFIPNLRDSKIKGFKKYKK